MAQHTPGPWARIAGERFKHDDSAGVKGPEGNYIATALDQNRYDKDDEVEANARLIASAPDLLELAKLVAQDYEDAADWKDARSKLASMARAALDKAGVAEGTSEDEDE